MILRPTFPDRRRRTNAAVKPEDAPGFWLAVEAVLDECVSRLDQAAPRVDPHKLFEPFHHGDALGYSRPQPREKGKDGR